MAGAAPVVVRVVVGGTDWLTRGVAIAGLLVATTSVTWQALIFQLGGPRLKVKLLMAWKGPTAIATGPVGSNYGQVMAQQGFTDELLAVEVTNVGRLPISISDAVARADTGFAISRAAWSINPPSPHRLEPYSSAKWYVDLATIRAAVSASAKTKPEWNRATPVRMVVSPVGGKAKATKDAIIIVP